MTKLRTALLTLSAVALAACGGGSDSSPSLPARTARGAITAVNATSITVNGIQLSTQGAVVKTDDNPSVSDLREGTVVRVDGTFDDRGGRASEIRIEHQLEGRVDGKGTDFVVVGGARVQVDDTVHYDDRISGFDAIGVGSMVAVSGVPVAPTGTDDKGGLRASRVDVSLFGDDQRVDVKGFVSNLVPGTSFELRLSPDATSYYAVDASGATADGAYADGSYVEVRTSTPPAAGSPPVIASMVATTIHVEDRLGGRAEFEVEGYVTSVAGDDFYVDAVPVHVSASTRYELGVKADLAVGVKVEAEGRLDASGVLQARKVSFRPGVRITAVVAGYTGTDLTLLGIPVQVPSYVDDRTGGTLADGMRVEIRGTPKADGSGIVALRITEESPDARVFLRAVATAKNEAARQFTVFGFTVTGGSYHYDRNGDGAKEQNVPASEFFSKVAPGRTVLKVRADTAGDVNGLAWTADEVEIED
jgi:hypothetical protein